MKIALVCDWFLPRVGGIERHLAELSARLGRAGHHVTLLTPCGSAHCAAPGVQLQQVPARLLPGASIIWTPAAFRGVGAMLRSGDFDLVHAHFSLFSPAAFAAVWHGHRAGLPVVATAHSVWGGWTWLLRRLDRWFAWSQWPVVYSAVSAHVAAELQGVVNRARVDVLPNAVDPSAWAVEPKRIPGEVHFVSVMRLVPRKRGAVLLRAMREAVRTTEAPRRVFLHVIGDGPQRSSLERLSRSLGLAKTVCFHGQQTTEGIREQFARADAFVLASRQEAFGIAALEARAAGLPVVALRDSGVSEFITDGVDGLLAADDDELAVCLRRLCRDDVLRHALPAHNQRTPVAFTWERCLAAHSRAYERACQLAAQATSPERHCAASL